MALPDEGKGHQAAVLIAGPTASGKSALALALAEELGGVVINADSMQVYRELQILTARPSPAEEARVPHRLYGHVPILEPYSVARWLGDVGQALAQARAAGRRAIIVGGTGLYFTALTRGLSPVPEVPEDVRLAVRRWLAAEGVAALHRALAERDPAMAARLPQGDTQRILRGLEVVMATGRPLSAWQRAARTGALIDPAQAVRLVLWPQRPALRARIDARVVQMIEAGALDEARAVAALMPDPALPGYRAHGLRPLLAHLAGEKSLDAAIAATAAETRRYAKRQLTWFRHQMADWPQIAPEAALAHVRAALQAGGGRDDFPAVSASSIAGGGESAQGKRAG